MRCIRLTVIFQHLCILCGNIIARLARGFRRKNRNAARHITCDSAFIEASLHNLRSGTIVKNIWIWFRLNLDPILLNQNLIFIRVSIPNFVQISSSPQPSVSFAKINDHLNPKLWHFICVNIISDLLGKKPQGVNESWFRWIPVLLLLYIRD